MAQMNTKYVVFDDPKTILCQRINSEYELNASNLFSFSIDNYFHALKQ